MLAADQFRSSRQCPVLCSGPLPAMHPRRQDVLDGPYHSVLGDRVVKLKMPVRQVMPVSRDVAACGPQEPSDRLTFQQMARTPCHPRKPYREIVAGFPVGIAVLAALAAREKSGSCSCCSLPRFGFS
ncbi:unnamed protein product [Symbiodinium natans]|uniref:Uncharacterized protein n=1 Tax=Symbiodinium natans TaxID=878477 RepID=A0A812LQY4_9DINO|nr:unnamed protein product [Symbiodinium natans]